MLLTMVMPSLAVERLLKHLSVIAWDKSLRMAASASMPAPSLLNGSVTYHYCGESLHCNQVTANWSKSFCNKEPTLLVLATHSWPPDFCLSTAHWGRRTLNLFMMSGFDETELLLLGCQMRDVGGLAVLQYLLVTS